MIRGLLLRASLIILVHAAPPVAMSEEPADYVPQYGVFPPAGTGNYFAGELVLADPINRRAGMRFDGDMTSNRYHAAPTFRFSLLPYCTIYYHGAPAELRDIPIGTHLHGTFCLPPAGDTSVPPPSGQVQYVPKQNHAITLEDDFSFYQRRGRSWKITAVDLAAGKLKVERTDSDKTDGLSGAQTFEIDHSTRIWKGRTLAELEDLAADQVVQLNLAWSPQWENRVFHLNDVWVDEESRKLAAETQRRVHLRYQHHHWLAGWVDHVEHQSGGKGIVTLTLFGGMDPSLYDEIRKSPASGVAIAVAEKTLRSYWQDHDNKGGRVVKLKEIKDAPLSSSGIQISVQVSELLEGFRPGRIVRVRLNGWPNVKLPPEERVMSLEER